ncbi:AAA family ATPase [Candidatus Nomurabacteria bacterium]|nr:AAA family ATPase [Candidatus Kaiserbacteria bacterium]MCB9814200.1 AAA family ATPase [Candidatus Nomurabacteria bacterium]
MYLKELSINGFKSFAKKSELEFSAAITAIVGPNGSGKSNIAESFRFVLGEQSVKSMRGKKGEDLIWGGSEKVSRGNRASVKVVFDNKARTFALDFDEVQIERIVHRDGQNEYKLNDSTVRLKDVHELLANANIGSTGHHIISQGEADRVLAAGPKERREMIEDALGLKVYQLKKQETERKFEKTRENILQVESLRREAAPHLKYLHKQVEKAERSLEVQKLLRTHLAEYLKREDTYVAFHFDRLTAERRGPAEELEKVRESLTDIKKVLKESEAKPISNELENAEQEFRQASGVRQEAEREMSRISGQISFIERRIATPPKAAVETNSLISRTQLEKLVLMIESSAEKAISRGGESSLERALNDLVHQLKTFLKHEQGEVIDTSEADKAELASIQKSLKKVEEQVLNATEEESRKKEELERIRGEQVSGTERNREAEREMFTSMNRQRELESTLVSIDRDLSMLERDRADFKNELQEAVSLLGRGASDYYSHEVLSPSGEVLNQEEMVNEDRSVQRERRREVEKLKIRLEELGIGATDELLKEYNNAKERDEFLARELADLEASVENLKELIVDMQAKLQEQFVGGLEKITVEFHTFFTLMFGGGSASLERVTLKNKMNEDSEEEVETEEGVELNISLPNKRVRGLDMLSGGERALTSIALIFAMSQVNPPPFIILDETDAALDEANSRRYGDMIEALAKKSQLVLITHNRETMARAGILYGITMGGDGVSKILSVKFDEAAAVAK